MRGLEVRGFWSLWAGALESCCKGPGAPSRLRDAHSPNPWLMALKAAVAPRSLLRRPASSWFWKSKSSQGAGHPQLPLLPSLEDEARTQAPGKLSRMCAGAPAEAALPLHLSLPSPARRMAV